MKSQFTDQSQEELIKAENRTVRSKIYKLINSIWNKEELPEEWKESIIVPIYKNGDKTDHTNYIGIPRLTLRYKIISFIYCQV